MTPVVIIIYNRALLTRNLIAALRSVRPGHLLVVADGPKQEKPQDAESVARTRAELNGIDWPCRVDYELAPSNLGCEERVRSGLDWVFTKVDSAIILEDDIDPHPSLFEWMGTLLHAYRDRDDIAMLSGHNHLVRWPRVVPGTCAIPSRRGAIWGWATWARAWKAVQQTNLHGSLEAVAEDIGRLDFEPALAGLYQTYLREARRGPLAWDVDWTLRMAVSGRVALVAPVNLVHHLGVGPDATHLSNSDDTLFYLPRSPVFLPPELQCIPVGSDDREFDRARVLLELLVCAKEPHVARRLARLPRLPLDPAVRVHLLPYLHNSESWAWLGHLRAEGLDEERYLRWSGVLAGDSDSVERA